MDTADDGTYSEIQTSSNVVKMETPIPKSNPISTLTNNHIHKPKEKIPPPKGNLGRSVHVFAPRTSSPLAIYQSDEDDDEEEEEEEDDEKNGISTSSQLKKSYSISNNNVVVSDDGKYSESRETSVGTNISTIDDEDEELHIGGTFELDQDKIIPLFVHGDHVLVFNHRDMKDLTIKFGITGQLAGTLPLAPQQNLLLGFPWRLTVYEALWCVNQGISILVDAEDVITNGYVNSLINNDHLQKTMTKDLQNRLDKWRDEKQREIEEQMKKLNIIKKDRTAMKPLDNFMLASSASMPDLQQVLNESEKKEEELRERKKKEREMHEKSKRNKIVFMETPSDDSRIKQIWSKLLTSKQYRKQSQINLLKMLLLNEVEDENKVWMNFVMYNYLKTNLGHYLLPGMRFGGTFVSYPGDPLRYHAHQIVETREYYEEDIGLFRMSNRGRLATGVRKVWVVGGTRNKSPSASSINTEIDEKEPNGQAVWANTESDVATTIAERILNRTVDMADEMVCFSIEWAGF